MTLHLLLRKGRSPTVAESDPRRIGGVTPFARGGFGPAEVAALAAMRELKVDELDELRT